jgi:phage replication O-like protein O|tara:strand:- start:42238 stop:43065 length:828 start_codon:yes stop_codon:yes gene_type:complete
MFEVPFTRMPNIIIDKYLPDLQGSELAILSVICRKTIGFNKVKDRIALTTFEKLSGQARSTVIKAVKELIRRQLIVKDTSTTPTTYSINSELLISDNFNPKEVVQKSNSGMIVEPEMVVKPNRQLVQKSNTQKNTIKKKKEATTSSVVSDNVLKVIEGWNRRFTKKVDYEDQYLISKIHFCLNEFSESQILEAMENRSNADYYKNKKPYLLNNPNCFFPYPETIRTDMVRGSKRLFTYKEMLDLVFIKGYKESEFKIRQDKKDSNGNPLRELKRK